MLKRIFKEGQYFHLFNKSIVNYGIFNNNKNKERFLIGIDYYNNFEAKRSLSLFLRKNSYEVNLFNNQINKIVKIISYCIMPDHYHLLLKILKDNLLSKYVNDFENSYTRFFNTKLERKGPLWQSNFKVVKIKSEEQLLHVSRYIHLNPVTSYLVDKPENWLYSSYKYFLNDVIIKNYLTEISINESNSYKEFIENQIDYQRKLKMMKKLILE